MLQTKNKINILPILLILTLSTSVSFSQNLFEGKVKIKVSSDNEIFFMNYFTNGTDIKIEMLNEGSELGSFIKSGDKTIILMQAQKMYMEINDDFIKNLPNMKEEQSEKEVKISKTGETKNINGFNCEKWIISNEEYNVEAWVTDQLGDFTILSNPMGSGYNPLWGPVFEQGGFFPILVVSKDEDDSENKFEVLEVEKQKLTKELFMPTSDYTKMNFPMMK